MSRTDKTRPYSVKLDEARAEDPYDARHEGFRNGDMALNGCPHSCWMCRGADDHRRAKRREGKRQSRDWQREY